MIIVLAMLDYLGNSTVEASDHEREREREMSNVPSASLSLTLRADYENNSKLVKAYSLIATYK